MASVEHSVVINSSPENIDAFTMNPSQLHEWYVGVQEAQPDANYPKVGGAMQVVYKAAGVTFHLTFTVVEYEYLKGVAYKIDGMMTGLSRFTLTPEKGGTRVVGKFDYEVPGGSLGKVLDKLVVEKMNSENLDKSLKNLKQIMES
jgi:uncharacterized membrane protein